jgi:hypothetical protein
VLRAERDRYVDFQAALEADEPVLLERLAFTQLRLKPIGTETADLRPTDPAAVIDSPDPDAIRQVTMNWQSAQPIEYWLSRPQLAPDAQAAPAIVRPRETRLIRAVTGDNRIWVAAFGALLLIVGLWPRRTPSA